VVIVLVVGGCDLLMLARLPTFSYARLPPNEGRMLVHCGSRGDMLIGLRSRRHHRPARNQLQQAYVPADRFDECQDAALPQTAARLSEVHPGHFAGAALALHRAGFDPARHRY
jgi:hypothetical protein